MGLAMLFSFLVWLTKLKSLNLTFTLVIDSSLKQLCWLTSLKLLDLDACQITDASLAAITSKHFQTFSYHCLDVNICFIRLLLWNHPYDYAFHSKLLRMVVFRIVASSIASSRLYDYAYVWRAFLLEIIICCL